MSTTNAEALLESLKAILLAENLSHDEKIKTMKILINAQNK